MSETETAHAIAHGIANSCASGAHDVEAIQRKIEAAIRAELAEAMEVMKPPVGWSDDGIATFVQQLRDMATSYSLQVGMAGPELQKRYVRVYDLLRMSADLIEASQVRSRAFVEKHKPKNAERS